MHSLESYTFFLDNFSLIIQGIKDDGPELFVFCLLFFCSGKSR